jgi:hypothetical protein
MKKKEDEREDDVEEQDIKNYEEKEVRKSVKKWKEQVEQKE